jgi:hypothetical protein
MIQYVKDFFQARTITHLTKTNHFSFRVLKVRETTQGVYDNLPRLTILEIRWSEGRGQFVAGDMAGEEITLLDSRSWILIED